MDPDRVRSGSQLWGTGGGTARQPAGCGRWEAARRRACHDPTKHTPATRPQGAAPRRPRDRAWLRTSVIARNRPCRSLAFSSPSPAGRGPALAVVLVSLESFVSPSTICRQGRRRWVRSGGLAVAAEAAGVARRGVAWVCLHQLLAQASAGQQRAPKEGRAAAPKKPSLPGAQQPHTFRTAVPNMFSMSSKEMASVSSTVSCSSPAARAAQAGVGNCARRGHARRRAGQRPGGATPTPRPSERGHPRQVRVATLAAARRGEAVQARGVLWWVLSWRRRWWGHPGLVGATHPQ